MIKALAIIKTRITTMFCIGVMALILLVGVNRVNGANRYSVATGNWSSTSTWSASSGGVSGASVPVVGDNVYIEGGFTVSTSSGTPVCNNLTISSGSTLTMYRQFTVSGTTSISGTINFGSTNSTSRTMTFNGAVTLNSGAVWNETATGAIPTFTFSNSLTNNATTFNAQTGTHTFSGASMTISGATITSIPNVAITGTYTNNGTFTVGNVLTGTGGLTQGTDDILNIGGTIDITTLTATTNGNIVNYLASGAQTVKPVSYLNLTLSGSGTKTISTGTSVGGNLSITGSIASLNTGINVAANSLTMDGFNKINGTWGSTTSSATNKDNTYFAATTGIVTVTNDTRPTPAFSGLTSSQSICFGASTVTLSGAVSASGPVYPEDGETVGVTINGNTQNATISGGAGGFSINFNSAAIPASGTPYTITYSYSGNVNLKAAANNTSTALTVNSVTAIASQATATQTQCISGTFTPITVTATGTGTLTYQWYSNTIASTTGGTSLNAANGAQTSSYTPQATSSGTLYFYCIVSGSCGTATSSISGAFVVNPNTFGGTVASAQTICSGTLPADLTLSGNTGSVLHWQKSSDIGFTSPTDIAGTSTTLTGATIGALTANTWFRAVVKSGACAEANSASVAITMNTTSSWLGSVSSDWNTASNWCTGVPTASTNVVIPSGGNQPVIGATAVCNNLTISSGATLTITGSNTLTVSGNWANNGGTFTRNSSAVIFNGTAQTIGGSSATTFNNLTFSGSGIKTLTTANCTVNGIFTMDGTATVSASPTYGSAATLQYNSTHTAGAEWLATFAATGGVIINGGTITLNAAKVFSVSVPLTLNSGATLNTSANNYQLTFGGNFNNNGGTFTANASPIVITDAMTTQSIAGFTTTGSLSITKTGGTATFQGNVTEAGLTISGSGGTLNLGSGLTHTLTGAVTISGNTLNGGANTLLSISGNWIKNGGTFTSGSGTITFNGSLPQTISGTSATTFNNLTLDNAMGLTLSASVTINGILNLNSGILSTGANTVTVTNVSGGGVIGGSNASFVNGPLIWSLASGQNYNFPVGKSFIYLPFGLSGITGTNPQLRIESFSGNAGGSPSSPLTSLSNTEYWSASVLSGAYGGGSVSLTRQTSLNELELIGRSATLTGAYSNLNGTVNETSIINSDNTGSSLGYFIMASNLSITTGTISPTGYCQGTSVNVPYTKSGSFNAGNVFTAQLSNASGSFASPVNIGSLTSQNAGTINATIPAGQANGTGYRIRVVSNNPIVTGSDNGVNISIGAPPITGVYPGSRCGPGAITLGATSSAGNINWYAALTGGNSLWTGTSYTTPSLTSSTTYYVDATVGSCTSTPRTPVLASVIPPATITAGGGGTFCTGSNITLTSSGTNITNQYWTGPNNFYSLEQNPVITNVTTAMSGTYTVTGSALSGINLVVNGDFELGNTGFTSGYAASADLFPEGTYAVVADPRSVHNQFISCPDHTSGTGLQMVVNGATIAGVTVWSETVNVVAGTDYQFTYWIQSVVGYNPSQLQLYANGIPAGPVYTALTPTCQWIQFIYNWNSGVSTTAVLSLVNQNIVAGGNDFALDDIVFQQACSSGSRTFELGNIASQTDFPGSSSVVVTVNAGVTAGAIGAAQSICRGSPPAPLTSVTAGSGSGTISYEWQTNASGSYVTIAGAFAASYSPPALNATTSFQRRTVSVSGGATCYSSYTSSITITVTGPTAVAGGPNTVCQAASPSAITLSGSGYSGTNTTGAAWSIISGGGLLSSILYTTSPATVTYTPAASYSGTAILRLTTNGGSCAAIADRTITINALATADAGTAISTCANAGAVNITTGASATNYASVVWTSSGTGTFANSNSLTTATYTPSGADITAGSVTLTLTATGNSPCGNAVSTKILTIIPTVGTPVFTLGAASTRCQGAGSVTYSATATN
ncbi:MAG: hypothetical protein WCP32_15055, partial [Bacteroidota bacterium]